MLRRIFIYLISSGFLFLICNPVYSKEISSKSIEKHISNVSNKFSRTYCNTSKFGISEEGALAFAIGETNKEFKNNKLNVYIDNSLLKNYIINNIENYCHVYNFPIRNLEKLELN